MTLKMPTRRHFQMSAAVSVFVAAAAAYGIGWDCVHTLLLAFEKSL